MAGSADFLKSQILGKIPLPEGDLSGRTVILTGANSGLGLDCAKHLVRLKVSRLIIACRDSSKGENAIQKIRAASAPYSAGPQTDIQAWNLEMTSYESVLAFVERCKSLDRIHDVILNAGVMMKDYEHAEDNETTITVNVISTMLLAVLILPKMRETKSKSPSIRHLTVVGSIVHYWAKSDLLTAPAEGQMLQSLDKPENFGGKVQRYNLSKLLVMFIVRELAAKVTVAEKDGKAPVVVNCVAPGWCKTPLFRSGGFGAESLALGVMGRSCEAGSRTLVHAAMAGKETHGQYLSECKVKPVSPFVRSTEGAALQKRVWMEMMEEMDKISPGAATTV